MSSNLPAQLEKMGVSRETFERLQIFERLVQKWNPKINLVSRSSLENIWDRHILDSIQVFRSVSSSLKWIDLGSGGGFPGIVVGILARDESPDTHVVLIESDQRKCAFLRTAVRETDINCTVLSERIEQAPPQNADVLSARALASLSDLLPFCERHLAKGGIALFPKGVTWKSEVAEAEQSWRFDVEPIASVTEPGAVILKIKGATRV